MVLVTIVLNRTDCFEALLHELTLHGFTGATILESTGMARSLSQEDEISFTSAFRLFLNPEREKSKPILMVTEDEKVHAISKIVNDVTGGLDKPDSGIIFAVPVTYMEGLSH